MLNYFLIVCLGYKLVYWALDLRIIHYDRYHIFMAIIVC